MTTITNGRPIFFLPSGGNTNSTYNPPFQFVQNSPLEIWVVTHNLRYYPDVRVYNEVFQQVTCGVQHLSLNRTQLSFTKPFVGSAYFI